MNQTGRGEWRGGRGQGLCPSIMRALEGLVVSLTWRAPAAVARGTQFGVLIKLPDDGGGGRGRLCKIRRDCSNMEKLYSDNNCLYFPFHARTTANPKERACFEDRKKSGMTPSCPPSW